MSQEDFIEKPDYTHFLHVRVITSKQEFSKRSEGHQVRKYLGKSSNRTHQLRWYKYSCNEKHPV
jgi:hypothetical protein